MNLQPETLFHNRYNLVSRVGAGGYSQVWLARDTRAENMEVALKIFAPGQGLDTQGLSIFSKEYATVFNLNHGNLLKPMHFDEFEGSPYLVLPYCPHGSIFSRIGEIDEMTVAVFLQQASSALEYLHRQDPPIIHQDIKPDNFLIDKEGNFLLADFGISSKIRRTLTRSMGEQSSAGTMAYMPPEKFTADRLSIKAGDIFSLGATMFELMAGEWPFGQHGGLTLNAGAEIPHLPSNFSQGINNIVRACLAKEPWDRPTAEQLHQYATQFLNTGQWPVVTPPSQSASSANVSNGDQGGKTQIGSAGASGNYSAENGSKVKKKSNGALIALIAAALVIIVAGIIFVPGLLKPTPIPDEEILVENTEAPAEIQTEDLTNRAQAALDAQERQPQVNQAQAEREAEAQAWNLARRTNTKASYEDYLTRYPNGTYASQARQAISALEVPRTTEVRLTGLKDTFGDTFDYAGEVQNNLPHGRGRATYTNGDTYVGQYRNGKMNGQGAYTYTSSGNRYEGSFVDDKRQGRGTFNWKSGERYVGDFTDNKFTGKGTYYFTNGDVYTGDFLELDFNGFGVLNYRDGDRYEGQFREDKRHGEGTYIAVGDRIINNCPDCKKYSGAWEAGIKQGFGRCYDSANRLIYEGPFKNDRPTGTYPNR